MPRKALLERIAEARRPRLAWPVGTGSVWESERTYGHDDSLFSPEEYGDYVVTSNEVFSAVSLRARLMSSLRLRLYRGTDAEKSEVTTGPAARLLKHVNPFWTWRRLTRMDEMCMGLWGESFWAVEPGRDGLPSEIWWMKPSRVFPLPHETDYLQGFVYHSLTGQLIPFRPDEVIWFRYPNPIDEFSALSPLAAARLAADTASSMMKANRNLHSQGLQLGGLIIPATNKVTFSETQARELEALLEKRWSKPENAKRWAVLRYEAQFKEMQVTPKDAEYVNGLNITLRMVCNAYGLPAPLLNEMSASTLTNVREYQKIAWEHALIPDSQLRADEIIEQLLPRFDRVRANPDHAEFDYSGVPALQEAASEAWAREAQAIERGALTINEWRKSKGMPPVPWGDVFWAPVNKSAVSSQSSRPQGDTSPNGAVDADEAASMMAALDMAQLEFRHGRMSLNGHRKVRT
ncbi:MAG TPA: phage portal protein [Jiangellaceae bacterium]|nr:phage portal protein [Jiangellaceae bacterium]